MQNNRIKVGILGCATIVEFALVNPARSIPELELYAIASRQSEKAAAYRTKYGITKAYPSYNDVLSDPQIDFVYIALPNDAHVEWAIKSAEAKKHILVEKPLCTDPIEIYRLNEICKKNGVYLLEALMVQHHPWQSELKMMIDSNMFGTLKNIETIITFIPKYDLAINYRGDPQKGGGCFYDLSPYWLQFVQSLRCLKDAHCDGESSFNGPNGIDTVFTASLSFADGLQCRFETSFEKPYCATHKLFFDDAILTISDIFRANTGRFKITGTVEHLKDKTTNKIFFSSASYYENQLRFFSDVIRGTRTNIPVEEAIKRIEYMGNIYRKAREKITIMKR
jgi:predicted dehydrogenase